jgi:hypothetical protein
MMPRPTITLQDILAKLSDAKPSGRGYRASCPAHRGDNPTSLSLTEGEHGRPVLFCHAHQCAYEDIVTALGFDLQGWKPRTDQRTGYTPTPPQTKLKGTDKIMIAGAVSEAIGLLLGPLPQHTLTLEDFPPYAAVLEEFWTAYTTHGTHEAVASVYLEWRPSLAVGAPNFLRALDRRIKDRLGKTLHDPEQPAREAPGRIDSLKNLMKETFPDPRALIPGILLEGLNLYIGKPKIGKSRLMLQIAVAVASGGKALGHIDVEAGAVLYISLEDPKRRLQKRCRSLLCTSEAPDKFDYATSWPRSDEGGIEKLETWIGEHPDARLIVIDTFKRFRPKCRANGNAYDEDYNALQPLLDLANRHPGLCIVVIHHTNKARDVEDIADMASGSQAMTGCVDGFSILRRQRGSADAVLFVNHKDLEEDLEHALKNDPETSGWTLLGDAAEYQMSEQRREIIQLLRSKHGPMTPKMIAQDLGRTDQKAMNALYKLLYLMSTAGELATPTHGYYALPLSYTHIGKDGKDGKDVQDSKDGKDDTGPSDPYRVPSDPYRALMSGKDGGKVVSVDTPTEIEQNRDNLTDLTILSALTNKPKSERCECGYPLADRQTVCPSCRRPRTEASA